MNRYEKYIGKTIGGKYEIRHLIGLGGTSVVFEATDIEHDGRSVAIKMLREELWREKAYMERLFAEADTLASLDHPCISKLYDRYGGEDMQYLVMEYVEGITLRQYLIKKGHLETQTIISIVTQILQVLSYLHKNGLVHGDIKPQNILLQANGRIVLSDFGVARQSEEEAFGPAEGEAVGTVYYLSPEQARGREAVFRSDLYSLGVMMYEMACGELPFVGEDAEEIAKKHLECRPASLRERIENIPKGMEQIIFGAMEKQLPMRYQSADQMLADLMQLRDDPFAVFDPHPGLRYTDDRSTDPAPEKKKEEEKNALSELEAPLLKKNSNSFLPYILGLCFAFLVVGLIILFYGYDRIFKDSKLNVFAVENVSSVTIEDYIDKPMTEALKEELGDLGYNVKITEEFSSDVDKGVIMAQKPEPGAVRKLGGFTLELVVSAGKDIKTMADYSMQYYIDVKYALIHEGYEVNVVMVDSDGYDHGTVVNTVPLPGAALEKGNTVTLFVSRGAEIQYITMPKLLGKDEMQAMDLIVRYELCVGKITYISSDEYATGTVVSQSIVQDSIVPRRSKVDLVIVG